MRIRSPRSREQLRIITAALQTVSFQLFQRTSVPEVRYTRLNEHYRKAVELARLILRFLSIEMRHGAVAGRGLLFNMADVFEEFVYEALREELSVPRHIFVRQVKGQYLRLDEESSLKLKPDLSWWDGDRCLFVGDVKYKRTLPVAGVQHPDIYQLLAYATASDLVTGLLIYAAGEAEKREYTIRNSDKVLSVRTMELGSKPEAIFDQVSELAREIRSRVLFVRSWHSKHDVIAA